MKNSVTARVAACLVLVLSLVAPPILSRDGVEASLQRERALPPQEDEPLDGRAEDRPQLLDLRVRAEGDPKGVWQLVAEGRVGISAVGARLTVRSDDGSLQPAGLHSSAEAPWTRILSLEGGSLIDERFDMAPASAEGGQAVIDFEYDKRPQYFLKSTHRVRLRQVESDSANGKADRLTAVVEPIFHPAPQSGEAELAESKLVEEAKAVASAEVTASGCAPGPGCTTVRGKIFVNTPPGVTTSTAAAPWECLIEAWDEDNTDHDDFLGSGFVQGDGSFEINFPDRDDNEPGECCTSDPYFVIKTSSAKHRVLDPRTSNSSDLMQPYLGFTRVWHNVPKSTATSIGTYTITLPADEAEGFWIYRTLSKGWWFARNNVARVAMDHLRVVAHVNNWNSGYAFDGHDSGSVHYYVFTNSYLGAQPLGEMHFGSGRIYEADILHEYGHWVQHKLNDGYYPIRQIPCSPHYFDRPAPNFPQACAFTEGWANYYSLASRGVSTMNQGSSWFDFENWTCSGFTCQNSVGDSVEGRITATLWDLQDSRNDGYDVDIQYAPSVMLAVMDAGTYANFWDYFQGWKVSGRNCNHFYFAALNNTIHYPCCNPGSICRTYYTTALYHQIGRFTPSRNWYADPNIDPPGYLVYGPYDTSFGGGRHRTTFSLKIDNNTADNLPVVTIDVTINSGATVLARRVITRREFTAANTWLGFQLEFHNPCYGNLETRVYWHDRALITVGDQFICQL